MRLVNAVIVLSVATLASADDAMLVSNGFETDSDVYENAAAHAPRFKDEAVWPNLTGKEYFLKQEWPEGRVLVWAKPGISSGRKGGGGVDFFDPKNWLVDGKPASQPPNHNTDVVFPGSGSAYRVYFKRIRVRHITIGAGAYVRTRGPSVSGNVWIKAGGCGFSGGGPLNCVGEGHTFYRSDNVDVPEVTDFRRKDIVANGFQGFEAAHTHLSQYLSFNKPDGSMEFIGYFKTLDEFRVYAGTVIVSRASRVMPGRAATPTVYKDGHIAILDGGIFQSHDNNLGAPDMTVYGTVSGGLPDRPLSVESAVHNLQFKARPPDELLRNGKYNKSAMVAMVIKPGGRYVSYTVDPDKARLVCQFGCEVSCNGFKEMEERNKPPLYGGDHRKVEWYDSAPRQLKILFGEESKVRNIEFRDIARGGLICGDTSDRHRWKGIRFGSGCKGSEEDLFRSVPPELLRLAEKER